MKQDYTVLVNGRYLIYLNSGIIYDTLKGQDIPQFVFKLRDKICK